MSLHHTQKKKYQGLKDQGLTAEELKKEMLAAEIAEADADAFIAEIYGPAVNGGGGDPSSPDAPPAGTPTAPPTPEQPAIAAASGTPKFNYKALEGEHYKQYLTYVASLPLFELRQFDCYKAQVKTQERYPGMPSTPVDVVGVEITTDKPLHTTKIDIKTANELNAQLPNSRRYYLLKQ